MQLTHSLKAPWFQSLITYEVKTWFQSHAFKWVNWYRYSKVYGVLVNQYAAFLDEALGGGCTSCIQLTQA
jgi:hypothetical protein